MRTRNCLLNISAVLAVGLVQAGFEAPSVRAQSAAILTGHVSSAEEGPMEGVVVSARKDGATITVSVVTNKEGKYTFPAGRLESGRYQLSIRAGGYELESPRTRLIGG
jgi:virginiamycin B lyase